ncbi:MAG: hypothetical protein NT105_19355 [Verrucomicrobia bacterium]|nr:hypothetical protein [Verrucomicrobiota bacterium]
MNKAITLLAATALAAIAAGPKPAPQEIPGGRFQPPSMPMAPGVPVVYEHSAEAGPDETFFIVGEKLSTNLVAWGVSASDPVGQQWLPRVQFLTGGYLAATLPEKAQDGPFVVWVKNAAGCSAPVVLNAPQPWWCFPNVASANDTVRVFGRNLARRPDGVEAFVYIAQAGRAGVWADVNEADKYSVSFSVPEGLAPGDHMVWVHAGAGGEFGWGEPVKLRVTAAAVEKEPAVTELPKVVELQRVLDAAGKRGGGVVKLPEGTFQFSGTLRIPTGVMLSGEGMDKTKLQLVHDPNATFARLGVSGWGHAPGAVHTPGDTMEYALDVPRAGEWTVWLRYATEMSPWKQPGVSGKHALIVDNGEPVPLENLPNTGSFGEFKWAKSATLKLSAGLHKLVWKNVKGGGISLDAFVLALDPAFVATEELTRSGQVSRLSNPSSTDKRDTSVTLDGRGACPALILQAEDCVKFVAKDGSLRTGDHAAIWLSGDGAAVENLTLLGNAQVNIGVAVRSPEPTTWLHNCRIEKVRVADCDGKQAENCGVLAVRAERATVVGNELRGRTPLFISGARQTEFARNRLVSVTRFGGNAEAAILGRCEPIEECVIEENLIASPRGAEAGGPTARRLLWFSTGHGSITHNWISGNGVEEPRGPGASVGTGQARFGGVAGTDQNVGEMILFEGNHRTAYFGPLAGADGASVTLPKTFPPTPDDRLGSVKREQLARDADNNETPFWPPDVDDGTPEPPMGEYYVTVFSGVGQGQTRRVVKRDGERLLLDRPWRVAPAKGSVVAVGTMFYRNLIVGNHTADGMTGVQLWISCVENVIAGNTIARQRKPGLFLYANGTTLASSMPRTWNRGISPLFWNVAEGNRVEECSAGALVTSGDAPKLPIEFPRALGNVLRHNSFIRSRSDGVVLISRKGAASAGDTSASVAGTVVEFNVVRDAATAYHAAGSSDAIVFRRNHAYFWYPVNISTNAPVAFAVDEPGATVAIEQNSVEGIHGGSESRIIQVKRAKENDR